MSTISELFQHPHQQRVTSVEVRRRASNPLISVLIAKRRLKFFGHATGDEPDAGASIDGSIRQWKKPKGRQDIRGQKP